ncbi:MAG: M28 family peptidase [bacterium]|nr:M28 family peptidase [bacterium]
MSNPVQRWLEHIRYLAGTIGPRGPTTPEEKKALDYCGRTLVTLGLPTGEDHFLSAGSVFRPHLVAALGFLAAFVIYPLSPPLTPWLAAILALAVLVSEVLELLQRPNPLQWVLPKAPSRNVYATVDPSGPAEQDLVLIGHVDTQRTAKIFSSPGWFLAYRTFSTVAFVSFVWMVFTYFLGAAFGWAWVWPASAVSAFMGLGLLALTVEADRSPFTPGANDNATAAGLVLTLAEELKAKPLRRTRVWCVCTGCEEALHEGAKTFFRVHKQALVNPRAIAFEMLGCSGPAWMVKEGVLLPIYSDRGLREVAMRVAAEHPELGAYPGSLQGGVGEMADALAAGVRAMTIIGLTPEGKAPYWHLATDTVDKMDPKVMERNYRFVRAMLGAVDAQWPTQL